MITEQQKSQFRRLLELRDKKDESEATAKAAKEEYQQAELEMCEEFQESGVEGTIKADLGPPYGSVSFRARETTYSEIYDDEAALRYFEERCMIDEVTAPKFSKKNVNAIVRDLNEQGLKLPPGVSFRKVRGMTITRPKGS